MSERNWGKKSHAEMSRECFFPKNYYKALGKKNINSIKTSNSKQRKLLKIYSKL